VNLRKSLANTNLSSIRAIRIPRQIRGPWPKAKYRWPREEGDSAALSDVIHLHIFDEFGHP
jgi:hypothetical protein